MPRIHPSTSRVDELACWSLVSSLPFIVTFYLSIFLLFYLSRIANEQPQARWQSIGVKSTGVETKDSDYDNNSRPPLEKKWGWAGDHRHQQQQLYLARAPITAKSGGRFLFWIYVYTSLSYFFSPNKCVEQSIMTRAFLTAKLAQV